MGGSLVAAPARPLATRPRFRKERTVAELLCYIFFNIIANEKRKKRLEIAVFNYNACTLCNLNTLMPFFALVCWDIWNCCALYLILGAFNQSFCFAYWPCTAPCSGVPSASLCIIIISFIKHYVSTIIIIAQDHSFIS